MTFARHAGVLRYCSWAPRARLGARWQRFPEPIISTQEQAPRSLVVRDFSGRIYLHQSPSYTNSPWRLSTLDTGRSMSRWTPRMGFHRPRTAKPKVSFPLASVRVLWQAPPDEHTRNTLEDSN